MRRYAKGKPCTSSRFMDFVEGPSQFCHVFRIPSDPLHCFRQHAGRLWDDGDNLRVTRSKECLVSGVPPALSSRPDPERSEGGAEGPAFFLYLVIPTGAQRSGGTCFSRITLSSRPDPERSEGGAEGPAFFLYLVSGTPPEPHSVLFHRLARPNDADRITRFAPRSRCRNARLR
jgi:hypothetical protein